MDRATLETLIAELRALRSPVERARLLARAWRTVRELSSEQRREIATRLGMKEVSTILQRLATQQEFLPEDVVREGIDVLNAMVPGSAEDPVDSAEAVEIETGIDADAIEAPAEPDPIETAAAKVVAEAAAEEVEAEETAPEPSGEAIAVEVIEPTVETEPERPPEPAVVIAPAAPAARDPLPEQLAGSETLVRRLRILRERVEDPDGCNDLPLEEVMARFPEGWPRRRALSILLRAGLPPSVDRAIALIASLERSSDRRWCAGVLADSRALSSDEAARLLELCPAPLLRRRLRPVLVLLS